MSVNIDSLFRNADPQISAILNNALSEKEISAEEQRKNICVCQAILSRQ